MVIYLSGEVEDAARLDEMTPRQIVAELDKHVVTPFTFNSLRRLRLS
jgi:hypothetical protein